jgi:4-aminobutyrate aminotransferase-like enzyme
MIKNHITYNPFSDWTFEFGGGAGDLVWDSSGKKLIDFTSGWNVTNLGWNNPKVSKAMQDQIKKNVYAPMWTSDPIQEQYANNLLSYMPKGMDLVCRATGGTEANEMAIKIARAATGRKKIIGFKETYHGQLFATLSLGAGAQDIEAIAPLVPQFIQIDYPFSTKAETQDSKKLNEFIQKLEVELKNNDVAAIVCEPEMITGWGSCLVGVKGLIKAIREATQKYGTLMIVDEVGTGFSRTGKLFGFQHSNITPDLITFAKGISNGGAAIGAVVTRSELVEPIQQQAHLISTFGWTPVACAAANATLLSHLEEKTWVQSETKGKIIYQTLLNEFNHDEKVREIRGIGMEIGLEFENNLASSVIKSCFEKGLHLVAGGSNLIQIMPPLNISNNNLEKGLNVLIEAVKNI